MGVYLFWESELSTGVDQWPSTVCSLKLLNSKSRLSNYLPCFFMFAAHKPHSYNGCVIMVESCPRPMNVFTVCSHHCTTKFCVCSFLVYRVLTIRPATHRPYLIREIFWLCCHVEAFCVCCLESPNHDSPSGELFLLL